MRRDTAHKGNKGQALVEFALILPVVLLLIFGIIDFARIFVAYSTASGALRDATRYAATVGYNETRYKECDAIIDVANNVWFLNSQTVTVTYIDHRSGFESAACSGTYGDDLETGDILHIRSAITITPLTPLVEQIIGDITWTMDAQRTVVIQIDVDFTSPVLLDADYDGLSDTWEEMELGTMDYDGDDDPDGDGCNNELEYEHGTDPNANPDPDTDLDGYPDCEEVLAGTDPNDGADYPAEDLDAVEDGFNAPYETAITIQILVNDIISENDTISLSFDTTGTNGGTITLNNQGTADVKDDTLTYTPPMGIHYSGPDSFTYTLTGTVNSDTAIVSITIDAPLPTPAPSPTPLDQAHTGPTFYDSINTEVNWRFNHGRVFVGTEDWDVEYWNGTGDFHAAEALLHTSPHCTSTLAFDEPLAFDFGSGGPTDCNVGDDGYTIRWTRTFGLGDTVDATLTTIANDGMRVYINGTEITDITTWENNKDENGLPVMKSTNYTFNAWSWYTVVVEYFETKGNNATAAFLISDGEADDSGICNWDQSTEEWYSAAFALSDSPGVNYSLDSTCYLELRGTVDLSAMGSAPQMTFMNIWNLVDANNTRLEIRESGGTWYSETMHAAQPSQILWQEEEIDLTSFAGQDFTGKTIEFRFVLDADATTTDDGWWIDNIIIEDNVIKTYTMPPAVLPALKVDDDVEDGNHFWDTDPGWVITADTGHTRHGSFGAWEAPTISGSTTLQLDGVFIMPADDSGTSDDDNPEIAFYHQYDLAAGDALYVEISSSEDFSSGVTALTTTAGVTGSPILTGPASSGAAFERVRIPLSDYRDQSFYVRFRLESAGSAAWYLDDIKIDYRIDGVLEYPFYDNMDYAVSDYSDTINDRWIVNDRWTVSPEQARNSLGAWSDSAGVEYLASSDASFETVFPITLVSAVNPELSFWHKRDIASGDYFIVEASTDYGSSWTEVWSYSYAGNEYDRQLAWERVAVDMSAYNTDDVTLRFRLYADASSQGNGIWIDDIRLAEADSTTRYEDSGNGVAFTNDMGSLVMTDYDPDGSLPYPDWHVGGDWGVEIAKVGNGVSDSPTGDYTTDTQSILELADPILVPPVSGSQFPVLSFWDKVALANGDYARVQVSEWNGSSWDAWTNVQTGGNQTTEILPHDYNTGHSWQFRQVDMRDYAGATVRLRFVLDALNDTSTPDIDAGWLIDEVKLALYDPTVYDTSFSEDGTSLNNWLQEGSWATESVSIGSTTGPAAEVNLVWGATVYNLRQYGTCQYNGGETASLIAENILDDGYIPWIWSWSSNCRDRTFTPSTGIVSSIDYDCGNGSPGISNSCSGYDDRTASKFTTTVSVPANTTYTVDMAHDDGVRLYVNGTMVIDRWWDTATSIAPTYNLSGGASGATYNLEVWYYENAGRAVLDVDVIAPETIIPGPSSTVFADSPGADYLYMDNMALLLDGVIDLSSINYEPVLQWNDKYALNGPACITPEVSLQYGSNGFEKWISLVDDVSPAYSASSGCADGDSEDWIDREVNLASALGISDFSNVKIALRFRVDGRTVSPSDDTGDGWLIRNVTLSERDTTPVYTTMQFNNGSDGDDTTMWDTSDGWGVDSVGIETAGGGGTVSTQWDMWVWMSTTWRGRCGYSNNLNGRINWATDAMNAAMASTDPGDGINLCWNVGKRQPAGSQTNQSGVDIYCSDDTLNNCTTGADRRNAVFIRSDSFNIASTGTINVTVGYDEGFRVFDTVSGSRIELTSGWTYTADTYTYDLTRSGDHVIEIHFYHEENANKLRVSIEQAAGPTITPYNAFHDSGPDSTPTLVGSGTNYAANSSTAMTLTGGVVQLGTNQTLSWDQMYDLAADTCGYVDIRVHGTSTWNSLAGTGIPVCGSATEDDSWQASSASLSAYNGQKVSIRFRLENTGSNQADGWWVNNITIN